MKNATISRVVAIFLLVCMMATLLVACNNNDKPDTDNTTETTLPQDNTVTKDPDAEYYEPEKVDYDKYEFRMLLQTDYYDDINQYYESTQGLSGDAVSSALYTRDAFLEEHFNIAISLETTTAANRAPKQVQLAMDADEDKWDICFLHNGMRQSVPYGFFLDVSGVHELNLEAPYWEESIQHDLSINGMIFALEGDYSILDELRTCGVFYNTKIYEEWSYQNTYGSPYELVEKGEWTYDTMLEMFKDTSIFANESEGTKEDRWGMLIEQYYGPYIFYVGAGLKTVEVVEDEIHILYNDDTHFNNAYDVIDKVLYTLFVNNDEVLWSYNKDILTDGTEAWNMFTEDKALFYVSTLYDALKLRNMESRFGILPVPKFYSAEDQEDYYCWVLLGTNAPLYFPKTNTTHGHLSTTAAITEAMCYYSKYTANGSLGVYDAFYEKMAYAKLCRTPDDYAMLEIIYGSKTYDIDSAVEFTDFPKMSFQITKGESLDYGLNDIYNMPVSYDSLRSDMQALKQNAQRTMDNYLSSLEKNLVETK